MICLVLNLDLLVTWVWVRVLNSVSNTTHNNQTFQTKYSNLFRILREIWEYLNNNSEKCRFLKISIDLIAFLNVLLLLWKRDYLLFHPKLGNFNASNVKSFYSNAHFILQNWLESDFMQISRKCQEQTQIMICFNT